MLTTQSSRRIKIAAQLVRYLLCLVILYYIASPGAEACTDCTIGLPNGAAPTLIDGIRGAEWDDASVLTSGDACLATILDEPGGVVTPRIIRVYSKRYNRGGPRVGFFFEIPDGTQINSANLNGMLTVGERIVLQFDSDKSRGTQLAGDTATTLFSQANDLQIIISHKGGNISGNVQQLEVKIFARDSFCAPNPAWTEITNDVTSNLPVVAVRNDQLASPGGYAAEIEIPLALLGTPTSDMGFAFAVINDTGNCATQVCDGYATAFPNTPNLPITNMENPVQGGCTGLGNWIVPDEWGTATFGPATGAVTVDRTPDYSSNDGLKVFECNSATPDYTWYKTKPCRARLEARLTNTTGATQTRNLLFLWAQRGSGNPLNYTFVSLVKNVSVPVGTNVGPYLAFPLPQLWENMPTGEDAHPCVRVYVLPTSFVPAFPESRFATISTRQDVVDMMGAYCLGQDQWTQKNISGAPDPTQVLCPTLSCRIAANDMKDVEPEASNTRVEVAAAQPLSDPLQVSRAIVTTDERPLYARTPLPAVYASSGANSLTLQQTSDNRPPIVDRPGTNVLMADDEFRLFSRKNVIVQVHTYGFSTPLSSQLPRYNFLEDLGSITQLIPVEVLVRLGEMPFQFNVVNAAVGRTIFHTVDVFIPAQVSGVQVGLDTRRTVYAANEKRIVQGFVRLPGGNTGGRFRRWGLSLHGGVSFPHSDFNTFFNPGPNAGVDLEFRVNNLFSLEAIYTFHRFRGETFDSGFPVTIGDLNLHQFSFNGKLYGSTSPVRPFFNFGGGAYKFDPGGTHGGINVGGGLQFSVTPNFAIDAMYNFHNVFTPGSDTKFSTAQGGVRFRF